ncbi:P-loop containing nucleoside triphosphate hydrolase protein [Mycena sp. CBHHK59/15]|nr:P-loop containing nucleoside triphosphate hydrolase protein [Mycena sp. CBHHK59/15]
MTNAEMDEWSGEGMSDVIIDVGTGCGKTLCFTLPLLLEATDIAMIVSPLSALMIDQAQSSKIPTVAVCGETLAQVGAEQVYADIVSGKFRQVIVSPEITTSLAFRKSTLSKPAFTSRLRCVCIDEAHCISLWGGSFRPDYADLGLLRGRIPSNVPFVVASATLPPHILDDVRSKLGLSQSATYIALTNARPNVALSCRAMKHPEESKADLRFLIDSTASKPADIPVTLVYCNQRLTCEDACDSLRRWARDENIPEDCIAFYHAKIGQAQKRHLEERLRKGEIRILFCTDAVGMGCDMRNIERVILWGLPPSFCALVQRAGRATRDFSKLGEAILIVPASVMKNRVSEEEIEIVDFLRHGSIPARYPLRESGGVINEPMNQENFPLPPRIVECLYERGSNHEVQHHHQAFKERFYDSVYFYQYRDPDYFCRADPKRIIDDIRKSGAPYWFVGAEARALALIYRVVAVAPGSGTDHDLGLVGAHDNDYDVGQGGGDGDDGLDDDPPARENSWNTPQIDNGDDEDIHQNAQSSLEFTMHDVNVQRKRKRTRSVLTTEI